MFQLFDGDFVLYDHGPVGNMEKYNRKTPPSYDLSNVRVPVSLYYGETDLIVTVAVSSNVQWVNILFIMGKIHLVKIFGVSHIATHGNTDGRLVWWSI